VSNNYVRIQKTVGGVHLHINVSKREE
jgi:hypothetical protein